MNTSLNTTQPNDLRSYSRHWLSEFIDMYQEEECLWQPKHPDYSNHNARNKAYDKLVEKLKEVEPNPDRPMVVRKINSLRSAFRREFRKINNKSNYETRLWYYDKLVFIAEHKPKFKESKMPRRELQLTFEDDDSMDFDDDQQQPPLEQQQQQQQQQQQPTTAEAVVSSQGETLSTITVTNDCMTLVKSEDHQQQQQQLVAQAQHTPAAEHTQHTAVKVLEITSLDSNSQREIQQAVNSLEHQHQLQQHLQQQAVAGQTTTLHQQVPTIQIAREHLQPLFTNSAYTTTAATPHRQDDEYDAIGINVASKLRVMNPTQRIIAEKLISDVLFNAQLDNLTVNSTLTQ